MIELHNGDCIEVMKGLADNSVDSIVTDPPYELGFMGKSWDNTGIANNVDMWRECLRVLKPGGYLLSFSATRTYHRMASAIEDAGFEIRDMIEWVYGSGFPKSLNIGKAVDKLQGNEREVVGDYIAPDGNSRIRGEVVNTYQHGLSVGVKDKITVGTSAFEGYGTALKPAHEPICMARKPLSEKTVAENCLKWGTGGINIDKSRVGTEIIKHNQDHKSLQKFKEQDGRKHKEVENPEPTYNQGRFPANLIHDNSEEVRECFPETKGALAPVKSGQKGFGGEIYGKFNSGGDDGVSFYGDQQGSAARFFKSIIYQPKASKSERNKGCEGLEEKQGGGMKGTELQTLLTGSGNIRNNMMKNNHPTVKPVKLMEYLIEMVTPENGTVLEPFLGSGTTGVAAVNLKRNFIGIELDKYYFAICEKRIAEAEKEMELKKPMFNYKTASVI